MARLLPTKESVNSTIAGSFASEEKGAELSLRTKPRLQIRAGWQKSRRFLNRTFALHASAWSGAWRDRPAKLEWKFHYLNHILPSSLFGGCVTKPGQYVRKAVGCFIYLFLVAGFHSMIAGSLQAQSVSFVGPKKFPAGTNPGEPVVGDFNQDGNKDLALAHSGSNDVSVLLGNGDGTFQPPVKFPVGGSPGSIVMDYFNGDSIQDLAVVNVNPPSISMLLGNGNGTFQPALNFPAGASSPTPSIDRGDFNGDHLLDLIVGTSAGFAVHLGNGNGTFRAPLDTPVTGNYVAGYFNDDGILDIASTFSAFPNPFNVVVRFGNGDGTFRPGASSPVGSATPGSITISTGYFNSDAIADLAVIYPISFVGSSRGAILLGNGDGTFRSEGDFSTPPAFSPVTVEDFNGDNIADLLIGRGNVSVALGRGDGTFRSSVLSFVVGDGSIVVGEFNSDGRKDLATGGGVVLGYGDGTFQTTWNYALGGSIPISTPQPRPVESEILALGEFNGDGIKDLAVVHAWVNRLSILLGNGDGSFQWAFDYNLGFSPGSTSIAVGEFNGDGIQDLIISGNGVFLGNGNGTFQPPLDFPTGSPSNGYVAVGYFNADRYQDIAVLPSSGPSEAGISVLLGNGDGTFQPSLSFDTGVPLGSSRHVKRALAVGDFNGDGSQDLVATNASSVSVLLGNGKGTFRAPLIFDTGGPGSVHSLGVGDFNNDYVQDLVVSIDNIVPSGGFSILLGNGNGTFRLPSFRRLEEVAGVGVGSVAVGDFNSDGFDDLILGTAHHLSTGLWVLVGNRDATFQPPVDVRVGTTGASFAIGLLSGDGRPDIAVGGCIPSPDNCVNRVSVLINNSSGGVKAEITRPAPGSTLASSTVTFVWNTGTGVSEYWLEIGTSPGGYQVYSQSQGTNLSVTVSGLPTNGSTVYVRLWSRINGAWQFNDYAYTATSSGGVKAQITRPAPGSTLASPTVAFVWNTGTGVSEYWLEVGTSPGGSQVYSQSQGTNLSVTVSGLPTNGSTVYVRLWSRINGAWQFNDYTYTTTSSGGVKAQITSPAPGSTLASSTVTFVWNTGTGVSEYWLEIGTSPGGSQIYSQSQGTNLSVTVSGLPTNGSTVYVRLWSRINGAWQFNDYTYTATSSGGRAQITSPAPGSTLASSTVAFVWNTGTGVPEYWLEVWTTLGGNQI
jgi:hypothetical protein